MGRVTKCVSPVSFPNSIMRNVGSERGFIEIPSQTPFNGTSLDNSHLNPNLARHLHTHSTEASHSKGEFLRGHSLSICLCREKTVGRPLICNLFVNENQSSFNVKSKAKSMHVTPQLT